LRETFRLIEAGFVIGNVVVQVIGNRPRRAARAEAEKVLSEALPAPGQRVRHHHRRLGLTGRGEGMPRSPPPPLSRAVSEPSAHPLALQVTLHLHDTAARAVREFTPITPGQARTCAAPPCRPSAYRPPRWPWSDVLTAGSRRAATG
jgi:hypothetical protein